MILFIILSTTFAWAGTHELQLSSQLGHPKFSFYEPKAVATLKSEQQVLDYLRNRKEFTESYFEQSREAYSGKYRFSKSCLIENRIGSIVSNASSHLFISDVIEGPEGEIGLCRSQSYHRALILYYNCASNWTVYRVAHEITDLPKDFELKGKVTCGN